MWFVEAPGRAQKTVPAPPRRPFLLLSVGRMRRLRWHLTSAVVCSTTSPRSPTPGIGEADGTH